MFILTSIVINSSLTSKRAHVCIPVVIVASLTVVKDSLSFFLVALLGFSSVRGKEKRLKPPFYCIHARDVSLPVETILQIPTVEVCNDELQTRCLNLTMIQRLTSL